MQRNLDEAAEHLQTRLDRHYPRPAQVKSITLIARVAYRHAGEWHEVIEYGVDQQDEPMIPGLPALVHKPDPALAALPIA